VLSRLSEFFMLPSKVLMYCSNTIFREHPIQRLERVIPKNKPPIEGGCKDKETAIKMFVALITRTQQGKTTFILF
jgi:hypothetical protein